MQPVFRIIADGEDITALINDRVLLLRTTDKTGMESDDFELKLDDRDSALALPARGAQLEVYLGYAGQELTRLGRYTVDQIDLTGPASTMEIRGKAADMRGTGKTIRSGSWENRTLQQIVHDIAARNGWQPQCPVTTVIPRVEQIKESDFNFITRIAQQYGCTAKIADGALLVLPRQGGKSASGKDLGVVEVALHDVRRWKFHLKDRATYKSVQSHYQDPATGKQQAVQVGNEDTPEDVSAVFTEKHIYPNKSAAEQAAKARLEAFKRSTATVYLEMAGRADLFAERMLRVKGFKDGLDGDYLIDNVTQTFTATGWDTTVQCNGTNQGKSTAKSQKTKQSKQLKVTQSKEPK